MLLGSTGAKAARRTLMKLTPDRDCEREKGARLFNWSLEASILIGWLGVYGSSCNAVKSSLFQNEKRRVIVSCASHKIVKQQDKTTTIEN